MKTLPNRFHHQVATKSPIIGSMDDLTHMTGDDARAWYRKWYAPNNATMVIVGDVNAKQAIKQVENAFGALKPSALPSRALPAGSTNPSQTSRSVCAF